ncbi:MAG TPA: hypothetical protein PLL26_07200 [Candidatus Dojkabacteria bacterium]|nr:hypothetical protein [Candidatus Dojkabacteria bacterium]
MAINEQILENMDKAAELAEEKLKEISQEHIIPIANWWHNNYLVAGHKRLAKILMKYSTKKESY